LPDGDGDAYTGAVNESATHAATAGRVLSLDQFRGYTVAGMLFVNFAGGFAAVHPLFKHHNTYCSYADTIMPQFFFAVGFALRLVMLRNREKLGLHAAFRRMLQRIALLIGLGLVVYNLNLEHSLTERFWRDSFQTLVHIGVTSLWVLPVITRSVRARVLFAAGSALLHVGFSMWFWYSLLHAKHVIDGGPFGFLTWTLPVIAGSVAHDWIREEATNGSAIRPLLGWGVVIMLGGYALSCFGIGGHWAAPPFFPPWRTVDSWTMSQRAGSASYQVFAAGFSLALYALFVWICDRRRWQLSIFGIFGANALAAYLLHTILEFPFAFVRHRDAPLWQAMLVTAAFIATNALVVWRMNRRGWYLRM
jgi:predicted acyltransferase